MRAETRAMRWLPVTHLERVMGIEPTSSAWKAEVLPLNYTRLFILFLLPRAFLERAKILTVSVNQTVEISVSLIVAVFIKRNCLTAPAVSLVVIQACITR